ncbi:hypothetical protein HC752_23755 [Vibrio sp. S9_S30]|uniref:hypothetical protein n=1 Tax=Vibrio sp. S9_S30 TaxID=2720226 RepID=UPI0016812723|nr:hypothetical protein [Vibrio sp. S9_S30]MBD1559941.1 hypothetical protein [Vibrio sp. S9_S30]
MPPNPVRNLDNSLTPSQQNGRDFFFGLKEDVTMPDGTEITVTRRAVFLSELDNILLNQSTGMDFVGGFSCEGCHALEPEKGFFGTNGRQNIEDPQILKIPHLRNLANRVGAFGIVPNEDVNMHTVPDPSVFDFKGDQIKGFGFLKDGGVDTIGNFFGSSRFFDSGKGTGFQTTQQRLDTEQYMFVFPGTWHRLWGSRSHSTTIQIQALSGLSYYSNELEKSVSLKHSVVKRSKLMWWQST